jgi:hypothetical protein
MSLRRGAGTTGYNHARNLVAGWDQQRADWLLAGALVGALRNAMWSELTDGITKLWRGGRSTRKSTCVTTAHSLVGLWRNLFWILYSFILVLQYAGFIWRVRWSNRVTKVSLSSGSVLTFKYLRTIITNQNYIYEEIKSRLNFGNGCYLPAQKLIFLPPIW